MTYKHTSDTLTRCTPCDGEFPSGHWHWRLNEAGNPEKKQCRVQARAASRKRREGSSRHKIPKAQAEAILARGCQACGSTENLCLDHDHSCHPGRAGCEKCIRGCLCRGCNAALGMIGEDTRRLNGLIDYVKSFSDLK